MNNFAINQQIGGSKELAFLLEDIKSVKDTLKRYELRKKELVAFVKETFGDTYSDYWINMMTTSRKGSVDWVKLQKEHPQITRLAEKYRRQPVDITIVKEGSGAA